MPYYTVTGTNTCSAAYHVAACAFASSVSNGNLRRGFVYEVIMGATSNPNSTDCVIQYDISRMSASGSLAGTSVAPVVVDPADSSQCSALAYITCTTDPTVTAATSLLNVGLNQRNSQRWVALQESQQLVWPATAGAGLVGRPLSPTYTGAVGITFSFRE